MNAVGNLDHAQAKVLGHPKVLLHAPLGAGDLEEGPAQAHLDGGGLEQGYLVSQHRPIADPRRPPAELDDVDPRARRGDDVANRIGPQALVQE